MTDPIDQLLTNIHSPTADSLLPSDDDPSKADPSNTARSPKPSATSQKSTPKNKSVAGNPSATFDEGIDALLADISDPSSPNPPILDSRSQPSSGSTPTIPLPVPSQTQSLKTQQPRSAAVSEPEPLQLLLNEVEQDYATQDYQDQQAALQRRQHKRQQQQVNEQHQRSHQRRKAQEWLQSLDPQSGDALWFEEFATNYESRIEAAIAYLFPDLQVQSATQNNQA